MPRPIVVGNGRILLALDDRYRIRDLCYPQVGLYNHLCGNSIRMGVWAGGLFSWIDEDGWTREFGYEAGTLTTKVKLTNTSLELTLDCEDAVVHHTDIYVRRILITNLGSRGLDCRLFFAHDLNIMESDIGDTAFYNPFLKGVIHYKGPNWFLFGGRTNAGGVMQYATGIKGFGGLQGTWRDAEDGGLSMNPIAQGSVDSTLGLHTRIEAGQRSEAQYWLVCGKDLPEITERFEFLKEKGVRPIIEESSDYWQTWSHRLVNASFQGHSDNEGSSPDNERRTPSTEALSPMQAFARQSLLILKTQIDNQGGILAANDSDIMETNRANYSYVWPRDGALVAEVLDSAGYHEEAERFFRFCAGPGVPNAQPRTPSTELADGSEAPSPDPSSIVGEESVSPANKGGGQSLITETQPFFLQKYRADGTFGASWHSWVAHGKAEVPHQEDETALTLHALAGHLDEAGNNDLLREIYEGFVVPASDHLLNYRDPQTSLPLPSYDLWEERRAVHTFTAGTVVAGLRAAAKLALSMGDDRTMSYAMAAEDTLAAIQQHLVRDGVLLRGLIETAPGTYEPDAAADASLLQLVTLDVLEPDDPVMMATAQRIEERLWVNSHIGGLARYEGDYYFRRNDAYPGNPWIICTLWLAQYKILTGRRDRAIELVEWAMRHASTTGVLPEQLHPDTGEHLSVSPLTWSHSEFIKTAMMLQATP